MKIKSGLPLNLNDLINLRTIENHRVEFKAAWNHKTAPAVVPFDDRRNLEARIEDISPTLVRHFLHLVGSDIVKEEYTDEELYLKLDILKSVNAHKVPRNVGLLFFNETPDKFFPGTQIEVVQFADDAGGDLIEERYFKGPLLAQIKNVLDYLKSLNGTLIQKISGQAEAERTVAIPYEAMKEAIVNAVYHRSYETEFGEGIKIYLYPGKMVITSYPGPMPGIEIEDLKQGRMLPQIRAKNRRIGHFLKDLQLAERQGTIKTYATA